MISFFRNFFQSKIGMPIFIGFLLLVALAFAAADVTGIGTPTVSAGDRVAVVGDERIDAAELVNTSTTAVQNLQQQQDPTLSMDRFVEQGGLEEVLDALILQTAIKGYAEKYGLRAGDNLVNSEILEIAAFQGPTGEFDPQVYEAALQRARLTDASFRKELNGRLLEQQIATAYSSPQVPEKFLKQYAAIEFQRRRGEIAFLPSSLFAPEGNPTDAQLEKFYSENRANYILPERRTLRYAGFSAANVNQDLEPTQAEITALYQENSDTYAARQVRDVSSFIVPTEEAARTLVARIRGGESLQQVAREARFNISTTQGQTRAQLAAALGDAVAASAFSAKEGEVAEPARSTLGWYVARVDKVTDIPTRTLAEATPELVAQLRQTKLTEALGNLGNAIDDAINDGSSLTEIARMFDLEIQTSAPLLADGQLFGGQGQRVNPALAPVVETAFQMQESEPQLTSIVPGAQYMVFEVSEITRSAAPPLAEIRDQVILGWRLDKGSDEARKAVDRVVKKVRGGETLAAALAAEGKSFPPVDKIDMPRQMLFANPNRRPPPPLALMFSMAEGSVKPYEGPNNVGWYVIDLDEIIIDELPDDPAALEAARADLVALLRNDYQSQLYAAIQDEMGVEINDDAVAAVRRQLTNTN